jgi:spermidine/putrescine transport system substrate-binding protein
MSKLVVAPSRRSVLKGALAASAAVFPAPAFVRNALASSGELNWFTWEDYAPQALVDKFVADTGIKVNVTTFSSNEDALNKLKAAGGVGWDIVQPSVAWISAHVDAGSVQALDLGRIKNLGNVDPSFIGSAESVGAVIGGKTYALPYDWGTEALAFDTNVIKLEYPTASFGDLWREDMKGKMLCRQRSIMLGTGLWMETTGALPAGTMKKAYDDEAAFDLGYGTAAEFVIANKAQIVNWWKGTADTQSGFLQDGAAIGMTWDGPIMQMRDQGMANMVYLSPAEGALMWMDSCAIASGAANLDQAYAFIDWAFLPENSGLMASLTGYNGVVKGFDNFVSDNFKANFAMAYPGDAISKLWLQGTERPWFLEKRQALVDKISAA